LFIIHICLSSCQVTLSLFPLVLPTSFSSLFPNSPLSGLALKDTCPSFPLGRSLFHALSEVPLLRLSFPIEIIEVSHLSVCLLSIPRYSNLNSRNESTYYFENIQLKKGTFFQRLCNYNYKLFHFGWYFFIHFFVNTFIHFGLFKKVFYEACGWMKDVLFTVLEAPQLLTTAH